MEFQPSDIGPEGRSGDLVSHKLRPYLRADEESRRAFYAIQLNRGLAQRESNSTSGRNSRGHQ